MGKKVRIALELDESFVRLLNANCQLSNLGNLKENYRQHSPMDVLALLVLLEARGATPEQIHAETPMEWRDGAIKILHDERSVIQK